MRLRPLLRKRFSNRSQKLHLLRRRLPKLLLTWRKLKRRLQTGRSKLKPPRKRLPRKWLMLRLLKRKERRSSKLLE